MLLNLSGAHGPYFTRNIVLVTDSDGRTGLGEVPGGENIKVAIEEAGRELSGRRVAQVNRIVSELHRRFASVDAGGRGNQTFDLRVGGHDTAVIHTTLLDLDGPV